MRTTHSREAAGPEPVSRRRTLDAIVEAASRAEGIHLTDVDTLTTLFGADRQLALPDHDPQAVRP